jgi:hypothetical protein
MASGFIVAEINGRAESLQSTLVTALDLLEGVTELAGALRHHFFEMLAVVFDLLFKMPLMKGALEAGNEDRFPERFDEIVVSATAHGLYAHIHVVHSRGDQEGHIRIGAPNVVEKFEAADAGHLEIGDYGIESLELQRLKGGFAIGSGSAVESRRMQQDGDELRGGGFVVDGEHADDRAMR